MTEQPGFATPPVREGRFSLYWRLTRMHKPIGILLLLWPTLWAVWIGSDGRPDPYVLFAYVLGTVLMRASGCAVNDWADRDFDRHVLRTRERPLTSGRIHGWEALMVSGVLALVSLLLILPFNRPTFLLACVAVFLAASYPFTKRFLAIPQAYLGVAFGFGIPMAFATTTGSVPWIGWEMLLANIFWAVAYDTEYAMVDRDDDVRIGIRTSALTFGRYDVLAVMICYAVALGLLGWIGRQLGFGLWFGAGLLVAAGMAVHHYVLIRDRNREGCFRAFNLNNWLGMAVFAGIALEYALAR